MAARLNVEYERTESAIASEQRPNLTLVENLPEGDRISFQKGEAREKTKVYVVTEEDSVSEQEKEYAEEKLYEAIIAILKESKILTASEAEECRIRNQRKRKMTGVKHEEL